MSARPDAENRTVADKARERTLAFVGGLLGDERNPPDPRLIAAAAKLLPPGDIDDDRLRRIYRAAVDLPAPTVETIAEASTNGGQPITSIEVDQIRREGAFVGFDNLEPVAADTRRANRDAALWRELHRLVLSIGREGVDVNRRLAEIAARESERSAAEAGFEGAEFLAAWETAEELFSNPPEPPEALVEGLIRLGFFGWIFGEPGSHKSWLALDLMVSIAQGKPWCGFETRQAACAYLVLDRTQDRYSIFDRLDKLIRARDADPMEVLPRIHVLSRDRWNRPLDLTSDKGFRLVEKALDERGVEVLFGDTLSHLHAGDELQNREILDALAALSTPGKRAAVVLHHTRKAGTLGRSSSELSELRGKGDLGGDAAFAIYTSEHRGLIRASFPKVSYGPTPEPIYFIPASKAEAGVPTLTDAPTEKAEKRRRNVDAMVAAIREAGPSGLSPAEVRDRLPEKVQDRTVRRYADDLAREGAIEVLGKNRGTRYRIRTDDSLSGLCPIPPEGDF